MNRHNVILLIVGIFLLAACNKAAILDEVIPPTSGTHNAVIIEDKVTASSYKILVDASKDGGVWWYPAGPSRYDLNAYHQGQPLANYLRAQGFAVDEIAIGAIVTSDLLSPYDRVIRACAIKNYTAGEITAYDNFLARGGSLLLCQDHLMYFQNDLLSKHLGVEFAGAGGTSIAVFTPHAITTGVTAIPFIAGSAVVNKDKSNMTILGTLAANDYIDLKRNNIKDANDAIAAPVMGILHHPTAKIFFIGDMNGIEQLPQPFTKNLVNWLFK